MPKETRRVVFSPYELHQAMAEFASRSGTPLPKGTLDKLHFDPKAEPALVIQRTVGGTGVPARIAFRLAEVAAALILYCRHHSVPLPKSARKNLESDPDGAALVVAYEWDAEG